MKYIIAIICSIILPVLSFEPKFCVNCKFFRNSFISDIKMRDNKYGKCAFFPIESKKCSTEFLVTGVKQNCDYFYCSTAREYENMCGKEGVKYEKNDKEP
jgi:hypothetical protein